jgi:hypothetical protein
MTLELLQEYITNKPFLVTLKALKEQLADAKGRICELEELDNKERSNDVEEQDMSADFETELEKAKKELLPSLEIPRSMIMIKEVLRNPDRYMGVISSFWDLYDRYHGLTTPDAYTETNTKFE